MQSPKAICNTSSPPSPPQTRSNDSASAIEAGGACERTRDKLREGGEGAESSPDSAQIAVLPLRDLTGEEIGRRDVGKSQAPKAQGGSECYSRLELEPYLARSRFSPATAVQHQSSTTLAASSLSPSFAVGSTFRLALSFNSRVSPSCTRLASCQGGPVPPDLRTR
jgi:hypothetical protein